jgi:hypothetical protein
MQREEKNKPKIPRWVMISGIGCAGIVLVAVGLSVGSFFFFRDALRSFEQADSTLETVSERHGPIDAFRADPGGAIRPERVEAFLSARESVAPARQETEETLLLLGGEDAGDGPKPFTSLRKFAAGVGLLHEVAGFLHRRNEVLLDVGVGLGEYYYIYTLAYYSWLGRSPGDGPSFRLVGDRGFVMEEIERLDETEVRARRAEMARESLNRLLLPVLREQLSAGAGHEVDGGLEAWREALAAEIEAMESDAGRLPWEDGLPPVLASSLEPYRDRLEASYDPMCNALEVGLARR